MESIAALEARWPTLIEGLQMTLLVGLVSMALAMVFGLVAAWAKLSSLRPVALAAETYTTVIRGVPELVLILLIYYGVPTLLQTTVRQWGPGFADFRLNLDPFTAGTITLGFIYGAFAAEVFRGAFLAVPRGQIEAAVASGMRRTLLFRRILLPQMMRYALPGLGNVWMVLIKATALMSVIQLEELMRKAEIAAGATRMPFTFFFAAALLFLGITAVSVLVQSRLERWANRGVRRV
ncbi:ABC transporter permease [Algihabitans albus]|uniref:ABC transporter permease n=1 Tax=Algihabitans albus TaxID=2164067 RepID=UPI000E5D2BF6|nr:ABC transporter permease subunit [Algihabitans albus]